MREKLQLEVAQLCKNSQSPRPATTQPNMTEKQTHPRPSPGSASTSENQIQELSPSIQQAIMSLLDPILAVLDPEKKTTGPRTLEQVPNSMQSRISTGQPVLQNANTPQQTAQQEQEAGPSLTMADFPPLPPAASQPDEEGFTIQCSARRKANRHRTQAAKQTAQPATEQPKQRKKKSGPKLPKVQKDNPCSILILPNDAHKNVHQRLQNLPEANARTLGVKRHVSFPSGACLITCKEASQVEKLRLIATKEGFTEKKRPSKPPQVRIHNIPGNTSIEELEGDIFSKFGEHTKQLQLFHYKQKERKELKFAVTDISLNLKNSMTKAK